MPRTEKSGRVELRLPDSVTAQYEEPMVLEDDSVAPKMDDSGAPDADTTADTPVNTPAADLIGSTPWSRRRFLGGTFGTLAASILAACRRSPPELLPTPTPTKTPTAAAKSILLPPTNTPRSEAQTYLPVIENGSSPLDLPTDVPTAEDKVAEAAQLATDTPIPPTDTPTQVPPTATPIPPPTGGTPFPPGAPSKLGLHVERNIPEIFELLETGGVSAITTLELDANFAAQIKQTSPATKLVGRIALPQVQLSQLGDPAGAARAFVEQLLPYADDERRRDHFDGWISHNEPNPGNADEMKRLSEFEAERVRLLGERGIRSVIGNFATGGPDLPLWEHFLPAVQAAQEHNGWLGLHEYAAPTIYYLSTREDQGRYPGVSPQDEGWLTLRYRKVYNQFLTPAGLAIPLIFTECGVDGLVQAGRPGPMPAKGWQDFQQYWAENGYGLWGPGAYVEQLVWFDEAMRQDWYVLGGCIYALGTSAQWLTYDISGPTLGVLKQYLSVHSPA